MSLVAAARVGHQVNHTSAFAGFIAGAIIGGLIAVAVVATVATGGLAAPALFAAASVGIGIGSFVGEMVGKHLIPGSPSGPIVRGSPNVFINGMSAAYCSSDVACSKHSAAKVAQGSATVGYNALPAARKGDKGTCGFAIGEGSENVFVGGEMGGCGLPVGDEVPWWARAAVMVIGLAGGVAGMARAGICALGIVARLGAGVVIGGVGSYAGNLLGGKLFGEGSFGQDLFGFLGGEAFSRLAQRGPFGRWMVGEPIDVVTGEVVVQHTDFRLPGALPLELNRFYSSGLIYNSCYGAKWASTWGQFVTADTAYAYFHSDDGRRIPFELPESDEEVRHVFTNKLRLRRTGDGFAVRDEQNRTQFFETKFGERFVISAIEDLNGYRIDFTYNKEGALRKVKHSGGYSLAVEGTAAAISRIELIGEDGSREELIRYSYHSNGLLSDIFNSSGLPMHLDYDDEARLTKWEDRRGTWFSYEYGDQGRCIRTRGSNGIYSGSLQYDDLALTNSYTDSLGNKTHYTYNLEFQVVKMRDARGGESFYEYDDRDNLLSYTDPLGNKTEYFYDSDGNLIRQVDALGAISGTSYNALNLPETATDALGLSVRREYDATGNITKLFEPNGNEFKYERDEWGNAFEIINSLGDKCELGYDAKGLVVSATDWKGNETVLRRNFKGLVSEKVDALGNRTRYEYVQFDKISKVILPTGAEISWKYDAEGNLTNYKDANGQNYRSDYGAFDLVSSERLPNNARRRYRYDNEARVTAVENELGEIYRFSYDELGNVVTEEDFAGRILRYEYDLAGRCTKKINGAGQIISFEHDALGQITKQINAEGEEATFEFDKLGGIVRSISSDGVEVAFERNELGQILNENQDGQTVRNEYDSLGRRTSRRTLRGGELKWNYDENSLPKELEFANGVNFLFEYDGLSRETSRKISGGLKLKREYDALDRIVKQSVGLDPNGELSRFVANLSEQNYTYDEIGNPLTLRDNSNGKTEYRYDVLGQITSVQRGFREVESYAYDIAGNIVQAANAIRQMQNAAWQGTRQIAAGNRLLQAGRIGYKYDADGRIIEKTSATGNRTERWKFEWSSEGLLKSLVNPKGECWQYRYDAFGRRVEKIGVNGTTRYIWDGAVIAAEVLPDGETTEWTFEDYSFRPLAKIDKDKVFAAVNDQSGKPLQLFDNSGESAWQMQTTLWSVPVDEHVAKTDCNLRFQGQWYDKESGLHYNFHRYYDPETGRYLSNDPIGLEGGMNTYGYVQNPLSWIDPFGLEDRFPSWMPTRQGYQRQHVVPYSLRNHPIFQQSGMSINGAQNMMYLPVAPGIDPNPNLGLHRGWTTEHADYNRAMQADLDALHNRSIQQNWSQNRTQQEILALQRERRQGFQTGRYTCA